DGGSATFLDDFFKLGAVIGNETDAFDKNVVNAPARRKSCHAIDDGDGLVARGKGDPGGNFATVWCERNRGAVSNFRPLRANDPGGIGSHQKLAEKVGSTFLIRGGELPPPGTHSLAGDKVKSDAFCQGRPHSLRKGFSPVTRVSDRKNL